jgi:hypothetical protein
LALLKAPPKQLKNATIQIRVEEKIRLDLDKYSEFIDANPSYIVSEALKLLFKKDAAFHLWLGQHTNNDNQENNGGESNTETRKQV